jgi:hypothetical protein
LDRILAIFAYLVLLAFLAILIWHVPRMDLIGVIGLTVLLAGWDLVVGLKEHRK